MSVYQYRSLGERQIRIAVLLPGPVDSPICCRIEHVNLDGRPFYEALSYVCGQGKAIHTIRIKHINGDSQLNIRPNLCNALRAIRHPNNARRIWADAICVDQDDNDERSKQVLMFGEIFCQASRVMTYIGGRLPDTERALALANQILGYAEQNRNNPRRPDLTVLVLEGQISALGFPHSDDPVWGALRELLRRKWGSRNWIVQESLLNEDMIMYCGRTEFPFELFSNILLYLTEPNLIPLIAVVSVDEIDFFTSGDLSNIPGTTLNFFVNVLSLMKLRKDIMLNNQQELTLLKLLEMCLRFECGDPRDKVYSLLYLAHDEHELGIVPNYNPTNRPQDTYTEAAVRIMEASGNLDILSNVKQSSKQLPLPSWVPDWSPVTGKPVSGLLFEIKYRQVHPYRATGNSTASIMVSGRFINLQVKVLDTIRLCSDTEDVTADEANVQRVQQWYSLVRSSTIYRTYGPGGANDSFWRTLIANVTHERRQAPPNYEINFAMWCEAMEIRLAPRWPGPCPFDPLSLGSFHSALKAALTSRLFCMSGEGFACLAPIETRPGDELCLIKGGRTPFIIRRSWDRVTLVGEAYAHGLMHGEGLSIPGSGWNSIRFS